MSTAPTSQYSLETHATPHYVHVRVQGGATRKNTSQMHRDIFAAWQQHQLRGLLVDVADVSFSEITITDDYHFAAELGDIGFRQVPRIAIVDAARRERPNNFFDNVAANRGVNLRFFYTGPEDAIAWLTK